VRNPAAWTMMYHGWFDADISDSAKLTIWAIYSFFNQQTREWIETPTVERVAQLRKLNVRAVKDHYQELEAAGLIRRKRTPIIGGGSVLKIEIVEPSRDNPTYSDRDSEGAENCTLTRVQKIAPSINTKSVIPKTGSPTQISNDIFVVEHKTATATNGEDFLKQEPFEAAVAKDWKIDQLANLRGYGPRIGQKRPSCSFSKETEAFLRLHFIEPLVGEIRTIFTQEQADDSEFVRECVMALKSKEDRARLDNPVGYLCVIVKSKWMDGDYLRRHELEKDRQSRQMEDGLQKFLAKLNEADARKSSRVY